MEQSSSTQHWYLFSLDQTFFFSFWFATCEESLALAKLFGVHAPLSLSVITTWASGYLLIIISYQVTVSSFFPAGSQCAYNLVGLLNNIRPCTSVCGWT